MLVPIFMFLFLDSAIVVLRDLQLITIHHYSDSLLLINRGFKQQVDGTFVLTGRAVCLR